MPINYENKLYLTVPEQVAKNKDDITILEELVNGIETLLAAI